MLNKQFFKYSTKKISERLLTKLKAPTDYYSLQNVKILSRYFDDYFNFSNLLVKNFPIGENSQIYLNDGGKYQYQGYIQIISGLNANETKDKLGSLARDFPELSTEIHPQVKGSKFKINKSLAKCSILNMNKNLSGIVNIHLYPDYIQNGQLRGAHNDIQDDFGRCYDRLVKFKEFYNVIEIQGEPDFGSDEGENYVYSRVLQFLNIIKREGVLDDKMISLRTKRVSIYFKCK
jgi:hypothetical protein